ncbi:uncharacterized protein ACRADG_005578 [Cochliomyia hominivorax]
MVQTSTESSGVVDAPANFNISESFTEEHSERIPTFRDAVDSFIEDIVEIGSKLGLATEQTSEPPSIVNRNSKNLKEIQRNSANPSESSTEQHEQNTEYPSPNNKTDDSQQITPEIQPISNTIESSSVTPALKESNGEESSTETPALKETVDSFINQVANISSSLGETVTEIIDDATTLKPKADNSNSVLSNGTSTHFEHSDTQNLEETHEKIPTLKEAVDAFVEDVVEIGSKLGFVPEQKPTEEVAPQIIEQENKTEESTASSDLNITNSNVEQTSMIIAEENTPTTLSPENSNFGRSAETLIQATSEISSSTHLEQSNTQNVVETHEKVPTLKEAVDAFIEDVVEIGSKLGFVPEQKPTEEVVPQIIEQESKTEESTAATDLNISNSNVEQSSINITEAIHSTTLSPENSNYGRSAETLIEGASEIENSTNLEQSKMQNFEESHEKVPTFKEAVHAFIEDVVEIGSRLGFVPEQKPTEEVVPQIIEQENKTGESIAATDLNITNSNVEQSSINITETIHSTTLSPENSNYGRSAETLIQSASEIGNSFSEAVSNLFSLSEAVTEIPNETSTKITTSEEQNKSNDLQTDSETSSISSPIKTNIEISTTTENLFQTLDNKEESTHMHVPESESSSDQAVKEGTEEVKPKEEVKSVQFVEYIPVAVITIPEEELESQRSAIAPQNETDQLQAGTKSTGEEHQVSNETKFAEDEVRSNAENKSAQKEVYETQSTPESQQPEELTTAQSSPEKETSSSESSKSEEQTTLPSVAPETTTQAHNAVIEETTNAFNKYENTLKTLIEQEKLKQQEKHLGTLETSQQETTTLAPNSQTLTTVKKESNTLVPQDQTTMLPKKFEEELQMAVKALEETTHHHFEEFQNNLKEAFKKFTVWGAEHERQAEATTNKHNIEATTQSSIKQPFTIKTEEDSASTTEKVVELSLTKEEEEEPHRIGAINQNFVDRFSDSYQENSEITATEEQKEEDESTLASEPETTEITFTLTTTMSPVEDDEDGKGSQEEQLVGVTDSVGPTTVPNISEEKPTPTAENIVKDNVEEAAVTTESIPETTIMPLLARVPLHKDITSISLTTGEKFATESLAQDEAATQPLEAEETHTELTQSQTAQPTEREQETITLSSPESFPQEMVTFIEHHEDTTTVRQAVEETTKEIEEKNTAKSQTQEPLTQAAFMEEQQQQIESTTEHEAQTQTAAASGQITATTANIEDDTMTTQQQQQEQLAEQQTTETEIYSTTVVEKEEEDETTVASITSTTAATAAVEPEARSLSLPPPKLEYLQNEDGVEIFYGYSIVKHN